MERLGLLLVEGLARLVVRALDVLPVQGQGHEGHGVAVLVLPEMLQAAEQPFAQGAGEPLRGPSSGLWQEFFLITLHH